MRFGSIGYCPQCSFPTERGFTCIYHRWINDTLGKKRCHFLYRVSSTEDD